MTPEEAIQNACRFSRDRLMLADLAVERGDLPEAASEIRAVAESMQAALEVLVEDGAEAPA